MKKGLPARFIFYTALLCLGNWKCNNEPSAVATPEPVLLIVGEDLSGTFKDSYSTTVDHLRELCQILSEKGRGGTIYLINIGNPSRKNQLFCTLKAVAPVPKNLTASRAIDAKKKYERAISENQQEIDKFLTACASVLASDNRNQPNTDINGFFMTARTLSEQSLYESHHQIIFVNSDGQQDTPNSKVIQCELKPNQPDFYVCGWENKSNCDPKEKLASPQEFVKLMQATL